MTNSEQWADALWYLIEVISVFSGGAVLIVITIAAAFYWARSGNKVRKD